MPKRISSDKKRLSFFKKITTRFKVSIINESSLEEIYHLKLSAFGLLAATFLMTGVILVGFSCLILFTPLRELLPENIEDGLREQVTDEAFKIDSLTEVVNIQNQYLEAVKTIISGDVKLDTSDTDTKNLIAAKREEIFLEKSEAEKEFSKAFEEEEMYNISNPTQTDNSIILFRPAAGILTSKFNPQEGQYGIDLTTNADATVSAAYKGVVFNVGYDFKTGFYAEITHNDNYITIYRGLGILFVQRGQSVSTGQVLGTVYSKQTDTKPFVHFELWHNNQPQNPINYIVFE